METLSFLDALNALETISNNNQNTSTAVIQSNAAHELIKALKCAAVDIRTLHRNLVGGNGFDIHELLGDYYNKIDEFEDSIVENLISIGVSDIKLDSANLLDPKHFEEKEALMKVKELLDNIKELSIKTRQEISIPTSVAPAFDELENFCQIESDYKLTHYLE